MDSQMDIRGLKEDCNRLIDHILHLKELDDQLLERIRQLTEERDRRKEQPFGQAEPERKKVPEAEVQGKEDGAGKEDSAEAMTGPAQRQAIRHDVPKGPQPYPEKNGQEKSGQDETEQVKTAQVRTEQEKGDPKKEAGPEPSQASVPAEEKMVRKPQQDTFLNREEEDALKQQIGLLYDGREIIVVYERGRAVQTLLQVLKVLALLAALLLLAGAITLAWYRAGRNGGFL